MKYFFYLINVLPLSDLEKTSCHRKIKGEGTNAFLSSV
jgi:hypothetical protein